MFGLTIVRKEYLEELEEDIERCEHALTYKERKISKAKTVLDKIKNESKQMNKNEIVDLCKELLKEMR
jgi:hypothetical protein